MTAAEFQTRAEFEARGYKFEVSEHSVSVSVRISSRLGGWKNVFFDSWYSPRFPLDACWKLALAEANRHFVMEKLS